MWMFMGWGVLGFCFHCFRIWFHCACGVWWVGMGLIGDRVG